MFEPGIMRIRFVNRAQLLIDLINLSEIPLTSGQLARRVPTEFGKKNQSIIRRLFRASPEVFEIEYRCFGTARHLVAAPDRWPSIQQEAADFLRKGTLRSRGKAHRERTVSAIPAYLTTRTHHHFAEESGTERPGPMGFRPFCLEILFQLEDQRLYS